MQGLLLITIEEKSNYEDLLWKDRSTVFPIIITGPKISNALY